MLKESREEKEKRLKLRTVDITPIKKLEQKVVVELVKEVLVEVTKEELVKEVVVEVTKEELVKEKFKKRRKKKEEFGVEVSTEETEEQEDV